MNIENNNKSQHEVENKEQEQEENRQQPVVSSQFPQVIIVKEDKRKSSTAWIWGIVITLLAVFFVGVLYLLTGIADTAIELKEYAAQQAQTTAQQQDLLIVINERLAGIQQELVRLTEQIRMGFQELFEQIKQMTL